MLSIILLLFFYIYFFQRLAKADESSLSDYELSGVRIADALKVTPADLFIRNSSKDKIEIKKQLKTQFEQILEKL